MRQQLGARARETAREKFLMNQLVEDWIDLCHCLSVSMSRCRDFGIGPRAYLCP